MIQKRERSGGSVLFAALMPHAPILVPDVGGRRIEDARSSVDAMKTIAQRLKAVRPQSLVLISPHSPRQSRAFGIWSGARLRGTLEQFGAPETGIDLANDVELAGAIKDQSVSAGLAVWDIPSGPLDHGALVPLWHLVNQGWDGPTVVLGLNYPGEGGLIDLGLGIRKAAARLDRQTAVVASGDMSHRLKPRAPAGYDPRAVDFDLAFIDTVRRGAYREIPDLDSELQNLAAEDVVDSTLIAVSSADWSNQGHEVLSYEGPFGVGYGVAVLFSSQEPNGEAATHSKKHCVEAGEILPVVARDSLLAAFGGGLDRIPEVESEYLAERHGVFVTIRDRNGELRGCVGTIKPKYPNVVEETWHLARDAGLRDSRFSPIQPGEIPALVFEVSVLGALEPVNSPDELDPSRWGVVVSAVDGRRGTMLPGIPEILTAADQIELTRRKAGIHAWESVRLERFSVQKFSGNATETPEV